MVPLLEDHEPGGGVGLVDGRDGVVAVEDEHVADPVELPGDLADALSGPAGRLPGGAVGRLEDDDQVALVLGRDERLGPRRSSSRSAPAGRGRARRWTTSTGLRSRGTCHRSPRPTSVPVEPTERREPRLAVLGPEEQPGDRRGERQRVEGGGTGTRRRSSWRTGCRACR